MSFRDTGKVWDLPRFREHLAGQDLGWANGVCLHHTAAPSLAMRPAGLKVHHLHNIRHYYERERGWSAGPHLFIDEDQIFGMTPLGERGIHARAYNATHIGIEVLGDYDTEDPTTGRGQQCWQLAASAVLQILPHCGGTEIKFHRDDPGTDKTCPGRLITREWFRDLLTLAGADPAHQPPQPASESQLALARRLDSIAWQLDQIRSEHLINPQSGK